MVTLASDPLILPMWQFKAEEFGHKKIISLYIPYEQGRNIAL